MAWAVPLVALDDFTSASENAKVYSPCRFDKDHVVPLVELIDARDDDEAIALVRSNHHWSVREIWDRHRLVARIGHST
jgi:hypothetical protein